VAERLAIDIGNTHIKLGVYRQSDGWIGEWRLSTDVRRTADEYRVAISSLLSDLMLKQVDQIVLASVVPLLTPALMRVGEVIGRRLPMEVSPPGYGLRVQYDPPEALGADRFLNALSAWHRLQRSLVVVDAGTTATIDATTQVSTMKLENIASAPRPAIRPRGGWSGRQAPPPGGAAVSGARGRRRRRSSPRRS